MGTDFSRAASEIIQHSEMLQTIGIRTISLVHVLNLRDLSRVETFSIEDLEAKLEMEKVKLEGKGFEVVAQMIYGFPHIELERVCQETGAGLLVIGSHGRTSPLSKIGGVTADVLQNIKIPVLEIPLRRKITGQEGFYGANYYEYELIMKRLEKAEPEWEMKCKTLTDHVLVPTDFSDFSEHAFQWIKNQNIAMPKVTLLHIQDEVKMDKHLKHKLEEFNKIDSARLTRIKDSFHVSHPETDIDFQLIYGKPTQAILDYIQTNNVSLTVMGSQGRGFWSGVFIGSVSFQVARNSSSNVLIVPIQ